MITYHDPRPALATPERPYRLAITEGPITLGLLANGFFDSELFLDLVAGEMASLLPIAAVRHWNKGNFSMPASDAVIDEIERTCGAVLQAFGH